MKIYRYIQTEVIVAFAFAAGGMLVLCLPGAAVSAVNKLAGVDIVVVLSFLPPLLANLLPYLLPLAFLLALVVSFGRLSSDNEWTAIRMSGMHPFRALFAPLPLALGLCAVSWWFCSEGLPVMRLVQERSVITALRKTITNLSPGRTELHLGKFSLIAAARDGNDFLQAVIHIPAMSGEEAKTFAARRVRFGFTGDEMIIYLDQARISHGTLDIISESPTFRIDLQELQKGSEKRFSGLRYQTSSEIFEQLENPALDPKRAEVLRFEVHQRGAISSIYLVFLFLGMPLGLLLGRRTQLGALSVAVGVALVYYLLALRLGQQLALNHVMPPFYCAWTVNALGFAVGLVLLRKVMRQ